MTTVNLKSARRLENAITEAIRLTHQKIQRAVLVRTDASTTPVDQLVDEATRELRAMIGTIDIYSVGRAQLRQAIHVSNTNNGIAELFATKSALEQRQHSLQSIAGQDISSIKRAHKTASDARAENLIRREEVMRHNQTATTIAEVPHLVNVVFNGVDDALISECIKNVAMISARITAINDEINSLNVQSQIELNDELIAIAREINFVLTK